jgi:hypothetical protein
LKLVSLFLMIFSVSALADLALIYQNETIYSTAQTYYNAEADKTVHVVGMIHVGPNQYFKDILEVLKLYQSPHAILLEEFATCEGQISTFELARCEPHQLQQAFEDVQFPVDKIFFDIQGQALISRMNNIGIIKKVSCKIDSQSGQYRPSVILERDAQRCREAEAYGLTCQAKVNFQQLQYQKVQADIRLTEEDEVTQLLTSLLYQTSRENECHRSKFVENLVVAKQDTHVRSLYEAINNFNLSGRDRLLFSELDKSLEKSQTVVTLWGAMHSKKIGKYLKTKNFKLINSEPIYFMNKEESKGWPGFQDLLNLINYKY